MIDFYNNYVVYYCWFLLVVIAVQTIVIILDPPDDNKLALSFYLAGPLIPAIAILMIPWAFYKAIEAAWLDSLKRHRQRVRR